MSSNPRLWHRFDTTQVLCSVAITSNSSKSSVPVAAIERIDNVEIDVDVALA